MKAFNLFCILLFSASPAVAADEYVAVDPSQLDTINGRTLLIAAYAIVLGLLALYWVYMTIQERKLDNNISLLENNENL
ncbi:MAG: hypothetical protein JXX29_07445 [Deltaproteobacteria bacterium]|nr:hypothetical protein [Deltaproteobacteria bacterium]MBN2671490.1 hypothetical protein [Deltaproteobacteria bacterium]